MKIKKWKGYSLLELMLVLVIAASLVIVAFYTYEKVKMYYQARSLETRLSEVIANYRALEVSTGHLNDKYTNNATLNDYLVGNVFKKVSDNNYTFEGNKILLDNTYASAYKSGGGYFLISLTLNKDLCSNFVNSLIQQKQAVISFLGKQYALEGTIYNPDEAGSVVNNFTVNDIVAECKVYDSMDFSFMFIYVYN